MRHDSQQMICNIMTNFTTILQLDPGKLSTYIDEKNKQWHKRLPTEKTFLSSLRFLKNAKPLTIHYYNFKLWHTEDEARRTDVPDRVIAATKREVDRINQLRNDSIEEADEFYCRELEEVGRTKPSAKLNTETIGSVIDRLSILSLKIYHVREESRRKTADSEHRNNARTRLKVLKKQRYDLEAAAAELIADLISGRKKLQIYRQFKMYNDPTLNPAIYRRKKK